MHSVTSNAVYEALGLKVEDITNNGSGINVTLTKDYHDYDEIYISLSIAEYGAVFKMLKTDTNIFSKSLSYILNLGSDNYHAWGAITFTGNQTLYNAISNIAGWNKNNFVTKVIGIKYK